MNADPELRLSYAEWGGWAADGRERMQAWADELARRWDEGKIDRAGIEAEFRKVLDPLRRKLKTCVQELK